MDCRVDGDKMRLYLNGGMSDTVNALPGAGVGLFSLNRTAANNIDVYKNGTFVESLANNSSAIPTGNVYALAANINNVIANTATGRRISLCGFGAQMDATKQAALYAAFMTYLTG